MRSIFLKLITVAGIFPGFAHAQDLMQLDALTQRFIRDEGLAVAVVENCKNPGFAMENNYQTRFETMIETLLSQGFTKEQVKTSLDTQGELVKNGGAAEFLTDNGVKRGDLGSLCRFAEAQIETGDTFGPFLTRR